MPSSNFFLDSTLCSCMSWAMLSLRLPTSTKKHCIRSQREHTATRSGSAMVNGLDSVSGSVEGSAAGGMLIDVRCFFLLFVRGGGEEDVLEAEGVGVDAFLERLRSRWANTS